MPDKMKRFEDFYLDRAMAKYPGLMAKLRSVGHIDPDTLRIVRTNKRAVEMYAVSVYMSSMHINCRCSIER